MVDATLITERTPDEYRSIRLLNTVAHHHVTIAREDDLGVNHWNDPKDHYYYHDHFFNFPQPLRFRGAFFKAEPRHRLPDLSADPDAGLPRRGGRSSTVGSRRATFSRWSSGSTFSSSPPARGPLGQVFSFRPEHSPYSQPQRRLCVGLYSGIRRPDPMNVTLSVSPGHGEMIVIPTITFDGIADALLMENVPGGDMEELATLNYQDNPKHFGRSFWTRWKNITPRPTTGSTPRASTSPSRRTCCKAAWCRRCATRWSNSRAENARSRSATSIPSSTR